MRRAAIVLLVLLVLLAGASAAWRSVRPSHDRRWSAEQARLATADIRGARVAITDVRNFTWPADGPPAEKWETRTYDLDALETAWYVVAPFDTDWRGPAHAFVSFGFADSQYVAISIEARREAGEEYSMLRGVLKGYELIYVIGDERDLIGGRVSRQQDDVFVYPVRATPEAVRALFLDMLGEANAIAAQPRFYGTLRSNCTTLLLTHVNRLLERPIGWGPRILLPGYSDALALRHGLVDTELSIEEARARYRINDAAVRWSGSADFPTRIRFR